LLFFLKKDQGYVVFFPPYEKRAQLIGGVNVVPSPSLRPVRIDGAFFPMVIVKSDCRSCFLNLHKGPDPLFTNVTERRDYFPSSYLMDQENFQHDDKGLMSLLDAR